MEWHAEELTDLDVSTVDHEGGFSALGVPDRIVAALAATGIDAPFRIQIAAIPDAIAGRDVLGRASTGSGKTLAFGVPVLSRLATTERPDRRPRALILSPTRELAMQIADVLSPLASSMDLSTILIAGGMGYGPQTRAFRKGVDLVVATPGRLVDLLETGDADLSGVDVVVLDEADHMADMGFMPAVSAILDAVPGEAQHLLFSATLDDAVSKLVKRYLHDPVTHEIDPEKGSVATATHHAFHIKPHEKVQLMCEISNRPGHTIVFARTQRGASRMAEQLRDAGVMAGALHGGLTQGARARVLAAFKKGTLPVLVATDVAARGIDVDDVTLVLQVDPPMNSKDYLHRSGRTARAGHDGAVVSLVLPHQRRSMTRLYHGAGVTPVQTQATLGDERVAEIAGCSPVSDEPIAQADYDALVAPRPQKSRKARRGGQYDSHRGHGNSHNNSHGYRGDRGGKGSYGRGDRGGHGSYGSRNDHGSREGYQKKYGRSGNDTW
ncbi:DEAD/DEAH box helicase [Acidipropionibacterium acidipropionici]|nr:DEAD/DEAH box helicase [Acidipropionibacterium acidipropionici]APZ10769.1 DEAD/DEAH box helicase [Acidipropionibacterium acidipropionici]